jgi:hypothetical protein
MGHHSGHESALYAVIFPTGVLAYGLAIKQYETPGF